MLVNVAVEVTVHTSEGETFIERTFIEDVSDLGCRFTTRGPAHQGDTVTLKLLDPGGKTPPTEEPRQYEIMWVAQNERKSTVGARLIKGEKTGNVATQPEASAQNHNLK